MKSSIQIICLVFLLISCKDVEPTASYAYEAKPHFSWGFAEFYGKYYQKYGVANNVLSMTLFSDSLTVSEDGSLGGFGQTLYLEDILLPPTDTLLQEQIYIVSTSLQPFTILPGRLDTIGDEVFPVGPSISYYEKDPTKSVGKLIKSGYISVSIQRDTIYSILCNLTTSDNLRVIGTFSSVLYHIDKSAASNARHNARILPLKNKYK